MNRNDLLAELLDCWQDALARGAPVALESLCHNTPELLPELSRRVAILRRFEALRADSAAETKDLNRGATGKGPQLPSPPAELPALPMAGEEFGGYRIVALLGEGGTGQVYRAVDPVLRREVALKVLKPEVAVRPVARERFLREARAMAALRHEHIIPIYQVGEVRGMPFLAMPLLEGETLAARLARDKALPPGDVLQIGREVAEGLAAAHAHGLIHRDIKPANIWLEAPRLAATRSRARSAADQEEGLGVRGNDFRIQLLDFGLAHQETQAEAVTQEGAVLGTPQYMSPEQADGQPLDARSDLFSLGCVLYECGTGQRAFQAATLTAVLAAVAQRQLTRMREVNPLMPDDLSVLIDRLLAKRPEDRPGSAQDVVEEIQAIEGMLETRTAIAPAPAPAARPRRKRRWPWSAAVAAVLVLGLSWAGSLWLKSSPPRKGLTAATDDRIVPVPALAVKKLDVGIWKKNDRNHKLDLSMAGSLPLRAGDWMRIEAETNRPAYLYLIYLDAQGDGSPLFPWRRYDWNDRPAEQKLKELNLPEDPMKSGAPLLEGPSGIEAVLLLAREEPLCPEEVGQLQSLFQEKPPQGKIDPLRGAVWLGLDDRFGHAADRGRPNFDQAVKLVDPVERMRRLVRGELKRFGGEVRGVCYPFQGN